ncbi:DUF6191 domain-containing protein [Kitasatospora sp. NPDC048545]|uniref:DUF6191 domain-containing protein n=1 Tax=Kitasatospora sp. NPDC048545 TaxID=3157208 RepID=UPI0033F556D2
MGLIVGAVAAVAAILGLAVLAAWQIRDEASPRPRRHGPGVGLGAGGLDELHALFSPGKRIQVEQKKEQLALRDDAHAGSPPHVGVDLDRGVAVLPRSGDRTPGPAPSDGSASGPALGGGSGSGPALGGGSGSSPAPGGKS